MKSRQIKYDLNLEKTSVLMTPVLMTPCVSKCNYAMHKKISVEGF